MYRYEINHMNSENSVTFESLKEVSAYTGLNMYLVRNSISNNLSVNGWTINRKKWKREPKRKETIEFNGDDGYLAISDRDAKYFADIKSASLHTGVPVATINYCIKDGGCANGWYFDFALKKETQKGDKKQ